MKPIAVELKAIRTSKKISLEVFLKLCAGLQIHPNEIFNKFSKEDLETLLFEQ